MDIGLCQFITNEATQVHPFLLFMYLEVELLFHEECSTLIDNP